jgi:hypothetical protein
VRECRCVCQLQVKVTLSSERRVRHCLFLNQVGKSNGTTRSRQTYLIPRVEVIRTSSPWFRFNFGFECIFRLSNRTVPKRISRRAAAVAMTRFSFISRSFSATSGRALSLSLPLSPSAHCRCPDFATFGRRRKRSDILYRLHSPFAVTNVDVSVTRLFSVLCFTNSDLFL